MSTNPNPNPNPNPSNNSNSNSRSAELEQPAEPKLPEPGKRNILITSALPYVNNVPHLGNIIGCVLSADTYARYCRARGYNAIYICGTDEYGTATETKAREENLTPRQLCDKYFAIHKDVYKWFDISFDHFGRTSMPKQTEIAQDIFCKLHDRGFCEKKIVQQLFCEQCNTFLADRFVEGICPHCGFEDARGDQCDQCGKLLDSLELKHPRCKFDRTTPVIKNSAHIFLDLPKVQGQLEDWINESSVKGDWTPNSVNLTKGWIATGLKPRCITRDLRWGTPVPLDGYRDKVFYVWFDAPIGYISITANYTDQWEKWWKNPEEVRLVQFMGKDNVPFHTVIFPSTLLATGENWTLLHHLSTTEYLNYEGGKFSKSRGTGVFGDSAQSTGIPADIWRFYLLSNRPETTDYTFSWDDFMCRNNSDLLDNIGNMCNRVLSFIRANFDSQIPNYKLPLIQADVDFLAIVDGGYRSYIQALEKVAIRDGVRVAMDISRAANKYLQEMGPWVLVKSDRDRCGTVLRIASDVILLLAHLLSPYTPELSRQIFRQLNLPDDDRLILLREPPAQTQSDQFIYPFNNYIGHVLSDGHTIGTVFPLIRKLQESEIKALKQQFLGNAFQDELQRADTITFTKDPSITWPCVIVALKDISVKKKSAGLEKWIKSVVSTLNFDEIAQKSHVSQYDQAKLLLVDRDEAPTSVHNLINIARTKKKLPNINTLVDVYNMVSLQEGVVMGAYDLKAIKGNLHFAVATGTESYVQVNQTQKQLISAGEWIIKDDAERVVTRITTKQSAESATTINTKNCIMCIQGNPSTSHEFLLNVASQLGKLLVEHCGGSFRIVYSDQK